MYTRMRLHHCVYVYVNTHLLVSIGICVISMLMFVHACVNTNLFYEEPNLRSFFSLFLEEKVSTYMLYICVYSRKHICKHICMNTWTQTNGWAMILITSWLRTTLNQSQRRVLVKQVTRGVVSWLEEVAMVRATWK